MCETKIHQTASYTFNLFDPQPIYWVNIRISLYKFNSLLDQFGLAMPSCNTNQIYSIVCMSKAENILQYSPCMLQDKLLLKRFFINI